MGSRVLTIIDGSFFELQHFYCLHCGNDLTADLGENHQSGRRNRVHCHQCQGDIDVEFTADYDSTAEMIRHQASIIAQLQKKLQKSQQRIKELRAEK